MTALRAALVAATVSSLLVSAMAETPLLVGDGKIATRPTKGFVYVCGGLARGPEMPALPWVRGEAWHPHEKLTVRGDERWPEARMEVHVSGDTRVISTNGVPGHGTGRFPIEPADAAFRYDRNPNRITSRSIVIHLPAAPAEASAPSCVPMGPVGFALTGAAVFNALDAGGRDAVAREVFDRCGGHPAPNGQYHYHGPSDCWPDASGPRGMHSDLIGYALDGFGLHGLRGEQGVELTTADLDECHGHTHDVVWDGQTRRMYHHHATRTYPYTIGCFRGTPVRMERRGPPPPRR